MNSTALISPPAAPRSHADQDNSPSVAAAEIVPLVDAVAGYGPPVFLLAGPWVLFALMLSGPFALLVVLVAFMVLAATALVAVAGVVLAAPYLLVRRHRARALSEPPRAVQLVPVKSTPRVVA
jgi:hypothetical protein